MKNESSNTTAQVLQPFEIIYNFRNRKADYQKPKRKASACERVRPVPEFTMRTRKMTAEIQLKHQYFDEANEENQEDGASRRDPFFNVDEEGYFFLKNEAYLQNGIPLSTGLDNENSYNFVESSQYSTYSKLEKALFGFSLEDGIEEE